MLVVSGRGLRVWGLRPSSFVKGVVFVTDHYQVLGVEPGAGQEEVQAAFDEALAARRARRQKTSDVHVAYAVLGDPALRRAYDLARVGEAASGKLVHAKAVTIEFAKEAIPEVDLNEVRRHTWQSVLRATVFVTGVTAKASEVTGALSRQVQQEAAKRITQ